jgi:hypothetical protein
LEARHGLQASSGLPLKTDKVQTNQDKPCDSAQTEHGSGDVTDWYD